MCGTCLRGPPGSPFDRNLMSRFATHTLASLSLDRSEDSFFSSLFPVFPLLLWSTGVSLSLRSPLKRCGVFVRLDKGCHSSPFPLLCGPGLAAPVEVQMVSSRRGYPRGPCGGPSLLQAWLITAVPPSSAPTSPLPSRCNHERHIPTTSTWPSFLLARFDGWHPSLHPPPPPPPHGLLPPAPLPHLSLTDSH